MCFRPAPPSRVGARWSTSPANAPLTPSDRLPVYVAAEFGRAKPLERLLKAGASPTKGGREDFVGASPLYVAARNGHMPCVMLLLTYGSPADGPPDAHFTPLLGAIEGNQGTVAKVLVSHGADANRRSAVDGAMGRARARRRRPTSPSNLPSLSRITRCGK